MCGRYYVEPESSSELLELIAEARRKAESAGEEVKTGEVFPRTRRRSSRTTDS